MSETPRDKQRFCIVIPAYMEEARVPDVIANIKQYAADILVVDDGSSDKTAEAARNAGATVIVHEHNMGKGAALATGFEHAREAGFDYLITMDADGQHDPADIPKFVQTYVNTGIPVLIGNRMNDTSCMPLIRKWTNMFTSWYLSRQMGQFIADTQCGYRLFRCDVIPYVSTISKRYDAESEILLHIAARGIRMDSVPVATIYGEEKSKINPLKDTLRFMAMIHRFKHGTRPHVS